MFLSVPDRVVLFFRQLKSLLAMAIDQRDTYYMKILRMKEGTVPDWVICAEFFGSMLRKWTDSKLSSLVTYDILIKLILNDIIKSEIKKEENEEEEEEEDDAERESRLEQVKKKLGEETVHGARLLAEIIAGMLTGESNEYHRRSVMYKKMENKSKINSIFSGILDL